MRKGTPKYEIRTYDTQVVVFGPASKTECNSVARSMNVKGRAASVYVQPQKKAG